MKPKIAANQSVYTFQKDLTLGQNIPGLAVYAAQFYLVTVNSISARFKTGVVNQAGQTTVVVLSKEKTDLMDVPNPVTHMWAKNNGAVVRPLTAQNNSNQCVNPPGLRNTVTCDTNTSIGTVYWTYEGPSVAAEVANLGEIEIYIDAKFSGRR